MHGITPAMPLANKAGKKTSRDKTALTVRIEPDGRVRKYTGRDAWMLRRLIDVGARGLTTLDLPTGVRASHYIMCLRRSGLSIESPREPHGGEWAGVHSRYKLMTELSVIEDAEAAA